MNQSTVGGLSASIKNSLILKVKEVGGGVTGGPLPPKGLPTCNAVEDQKGRCLKLPFAAHSAASDPSLQTTPYQSQHLCTPQSRDPQQSNVHF